MWAIKKLPNKRHRSLFIALKNENHANQFVIRIAVSIDDPTIDARNFAAHTRISSALKRPSSPAWAVF
jgi:hypothetical protein